MVCRLLDHFASQGVQARLQAQPSTFGAAVAAVLHSTGLKAQCSVRIGPYTMGVIVEGAQGATCAVNLNGEDGEHGAMKRWRSRWALCA